MDFLSLSRGDCDPYFIKFFYKGEGKMQKVKVWWGLFLLIVFLGLAGCSSSGSSSSGGDSSTPAVAANPFVGSWKVTGSADAWLYIDSNNTFVWADVPDKTHPHFSGTWSVTNGTFTGPFTNPGVGTGDLVGTIAANGVMTIDFVEHWNTPNKHVPYSATKLNAKLPVKR
jgi:hypothetical protein